MLCARARLIFRARAAGSISCKNLAFLSCPDISKRRWERYSAMLCDAMPSHLLMPRRACASGHVHRISMRRATNRCARPSCCPVNALLWKKSVVNIAGAWAHTNELGTLASLMQFPWKHMTFVVYSYMSKCVFLVHIKRCPISCTCSKYVYFMCTFLKMSIFVPFENMSNLC